MPLEKVMTFFKLSGPTEALLRHRDQLGGVPAVQLIRAPGIDRQVAGCGWCRRRGSSPRFRSLGAYARIHRQRWLTTQNAGVWRDAS